MRGVLHTVADTISESIDAGTVKSKRRQPKFDAVAVRIGQERLANWDHDRAAAVAYAVLVLGHAMNVAAWLGCPVADVERTLMSRCGELDRAEGVA